MLINLKGKHQVAYPKYMYKAGLNYQYKNLRLNFNVNYIAKRPISYMNDAYAPAYWLANTGISYSLGELGFMKKLVFNFNVNNLFNRTYVSSTGVFGYSMSGDSPTLFVGAPREFFGTVSGQF